MKNIAEQTSLEKQFRTNPIETKNCENIFHVLLSKIKKMDSSLWLRLPKILNYLLENDLLPPNFRDFL